MKKLKQYYKSLLQKSLLHHGEICELEAAGYIRKTGENYTLTQRGISAKRH